jgi:hypothetical protein
LIGVLLRLQALTLRGRVVRSLRLMRQPKYLIGSIAGALWMGAWVLRPILRTSRSTRAAGLDRVPADLLPSVHLVAALVVTVAILLPWLLPWGRPGIKLREAELTFLLQAPVTRRQIIGYALAKAGLGTLLGAAIVSWSLGADLGGRLALFAAILPLFAFWTLNGKWRAMFLLEQRTHPRAGMRRAIVTVLCGGYVVTLLVLAARFGARLVADGASAPWPPLLSTLLAPGRWLTAPFFFMDGASRVLPAVLPVVLLALVQLEIVLRSRAPFEESSLEWAREHDTRRATGRRTARGRLTRRWQVFDLPSEGRPEVAIVWKNLMRVSRLPLVRGAAAALVFLVVLLGLAWIVPVYPAIHGTIAVTGLVAAGAAPLFAGMSWNNDFRTELPHLELVRTWPVAPVRFVLAEIAAPALLSTLMGIFGLGVALVGFLGVEIGSGQGVPLDILPDSGVLGVSTTGLVLLALTAFVPLVAGAAFATSAMQNVATLFVPAWMAHTADSQRGIAGFGRNMVIGTAMFFAFLLVLLPSAALVGLAILAQHLAGIPWSAWAFPLWGMLATAPLVALGWVLVRLAAALWADLDPSQELLEIGR